MAKHKACQCSDIPMVMQHTGWSSYPWGFGPLQLEDTISSWKDAGLGHVGVAATYHCTRVLLPNHPTHTLWHIPPGRMHFQPNLSRYSGCRLQPLAAEWQEGQDVFGTIRTAAGRAGLAFSAGVNGCHNSRLGRAHPDCTVQNALGDVFPHALDPAHPDVQEYLAAVVDDLGSQHRPEAVGLAAFGYYGYKHPSHHDKRGIPFDGLLDFLYSLSFNPYSMRAIGAVGLDPKELRGKVQLWLRALLAGCSRPSVDTDAEIAAAVDERLGEGVSQRLIQARTAVTVSLLRRIKSVVPQGTRLSLAVDRSPFATGAQVGLDLTRLRGLVDSVSIYLTPSVRLDQTPGELKCVAEALGLGVRLLLIVDCYGARAGSPEALREYLQTGLQGGVGGFRLHHWDMCTEHDRAVAHEALSGLRLE